MEFLEGIQRGESLPGLQVGFVPVHAGALQRPLFVIQDQESVDAVFALVPERFGANIPIYGLSLQAIETPRPQTVEGFATRMIETIRGMQPTGPYRLAGWSQCGLVAYEIATQLVGQDQTVEFVGLLGQSVRCDHYVPHSTPSIPVHIFTGPKQSSASESEGMVEWQTLLPASQIRLVAVPSVDCNTRTQIRLLGHALAGVLNEAADFDHEIREAQYSPRFTIQTGKGKRDRRPLFCIPGAGDSVTGFTSLAAALGDDWPVHGLQPRGVDGSMIPHSTVEAAAESYIRAINSLHLHEPIHLIGHSFGGWVAFEIACRLRAANRSIASLTLIDSDAPEGGGILGNEYTSPAIAARFVESLEMTAEQPLGIEPELLNSLGHAQCLRTVHAGMVRVGMASARSKPEMLKGSLRTFGTALRTIYQPRQKYSGPTRLVVVQDCRLDANENITQYQRVISGWQRWTPHLSYWDGPGNHMTILKSPHVDELSQWWIAGLSETAGRLKRSPD